MERAACCGEGTDLEDQAWNIEVIAQTATAPAQEVWYLDKTVPEYAFLGCDQLGDVTIFAVPGLGSVGRSAFAFSNLAGLDLTEVVAYGDFEIGERAFEGCSSVVSVRLPAAATVGPRAFEGCSGLPADVLAALERLRGP